MSGQLGKQPGQAGFVGIESIEHAESVLKSLRKTSSSARNYQTIGDSSNAEKQLASFNKMVVEKGKEVVDHQLEREKETAMLNMIGSDCDSTMGGTSMLISHELKSDRYEISPSKLSTLGHQQQQQQGTESYNNIERVALNRPSKNNKQKVNKSGDDDEYADFGDDDFGTYGTSMQEGGHDSPPKFYPNEDMRYNDDDSDDEMLQTLTMDELGFSGANSAMGVKSPNSKMAFSSNNNKNAGAGAGQFKQGSTSYMSDGVRKDMLRPEGGSVDLHEHQRGRDKNVMGMSTETTDSQDFANGLAALMKSQNMEESINSDYDGHSNNNNSNSKGSPARSTVSHATHGTQNSMNSMNMSVTNVKKSSQAPGKMTIMSKTAPTKDMDIRNKGAILKKGGMFVRAGGKSKVREHLASTHK